MISLGRKITHNFAFTDNIPKKRQIALNWLNKGEIILAKITGLILITTGLILALNLVWPLFVNISNIFIIVILGTGSIFALGIGSRLWINSNKIGKFIAIFILVLGFILTAKFIFGFVFSFFSLGLLVTQGFGVWLLLWIGLYWFRTGAFRFPWQYP